MRRNCSTMNLRQVISWPRAARSLTNALGTVIDAQEIGSSLFTLQPSGGRSPASMESTRPPKHRESEKARARDVTSSCGGFHTKAAVSAIAEHRGSALQGPIRVARRKQPEAANCICLNINLTGETEDDQIRFLLEICPAGRIDNNDRVVRNGAGSDGRRPASPPK